MSFIAEWFKDVFRYRLNLDNKLEKADEERVLLLISATFNCAAGRELLKYWVDVISMNPPQSFDPYESINWQTKSKFVSDIIRAVDAAEHPDKYKQEQAKPRHVVGGQIGGR